MQTDRQTDRRDSPTYRLNDAESGCHLSSALMATPGTANKQTRSQSVKTRLMVSFPNNRNEKGGGGASPYPKKQTKNNNKSSVITCNDKMLMSVLRVVRGGLDAPVCPGRAG